MASKESIDSSDDDGWKDKQKKDESDAVSSVTETVKAWHFVGDKLRDGSLVPEDGAELRHEGPLVMCESGLHASESILDALKYALGNTLCEVECGGEIIRGDDKLVCSQRTIVRRLDAEPVLRAFARWCALTVVHQWDPPSIVMTYLLTGDPSAGDAAWAAAAAAGAAAPEAAWAAPEAAWAAAAAAWAAAAAAWAAAGEAAREAARDAARAQLTAMVEEAFAGRTEWVFERPSGDTTGQEGETLPAPVEKPDPPSDTPADV